MEGHVSTQGIGLSSESLSSGFVTTAQLQKMVVFDGGVEHTLPWRSSQQPGVLCKGHDSRHVWPSSREGFAEYVRSGALPSCRRCYKRSVRILVLIDSLRRILARRFII